MSTANECQDAVTKAYSRLTRKELILLLSLRTLPVHGDVHELAFRLAVHDLSHRTDLNTPRLHTPPPSTDISFNEDSAPFGLHPSDETKTDPEFPDQHHADDTRSEASVPAHNIPSLPPELWADIFEWIADWELATAVGVHTNLRPNPDWVRTATRLDYAILSGSVPYVSSFLRSHPSVRFTKFGAKIMVRFAYTDLLSFLHSRFPIEFAAVFSDKSITIPTLASRFGQTKVLSWWQEASDPSTPNAIKRDYDDEPLDEASRKGHIHVLQWWKSSGLPLRYGLVMDVASSAGQLLVLEWWKNSGLPLEYRHALKRASYNGEVEVLEWWKRSGLRLIYDKEVLVEATKFNRVEVLEWWCKSGLRVEYLLCDIEGALEDAIGGGREAREWWVKRGVRFDVTVKEWMEYKVL